uniref:Uncharacterized protein n=1 Tax=Haptolina ericina TaxID=156174 RepID=A0A7S3B1A9_9EUKA|mmetsp:Transcript_46567/g.104990  ORF Transcript_46567/g.104990 Transcript_46567/m.104990 type:complete len:122 (+) Transcript_46567:294-659(+)
MDDGLSNCLFNCLFNCLHTCCSPCFVCRFARYVPARNYEVPSDDFEDVLSLIAARSHGSWVCSERECAPWRGVVVVVVRWGLRVSVPPACSVPPPFCVCCERSLRSPESLCVRVRLCVYRA